MTSIKLQNITLKMALYGSDDSMTIRNLCFNKVYTISIWHNDSNTANNKDNNPTKVVCILFLRKDSHKNFSLKLQGLFIRHKSKDKWQSKLTLEHLTKDHMNPKIRSKSTTYAFIVRKWSIGVWIALKNIFKAATNIITTFHENKKSKST